jgi:hypothetical protein
MRKRKKLRGTVEKVVKHYGEPEKAQIEIQEADPLYRELRVENEAEPDGDGNKHRFEKSEDVDVIIESDGKRQQK